MWIHLAQGRDMTQVVSTFEHINDNFCSIKGAEFLEQLCFLWTLMLQAVSMLI
jgi:hypothetical protein